MPYYCETISEKWPEKKRRDLDVFLLSRGSVRARRFEFGKVLDQGNRRVMIAPQRTHIEDNEIFHRLFLWPLDYLLRLDDASLVHGALLGKKGQGILILGEKGTGKSTLSTACISQGYRYFSDEHPLVEIRAKKVWGRSFISPIALPPR